MDIDQYRGRVQPSSKRRRIADGKATARTSGLIDHLGLTYVGSRCPRDGQIKGNETVICVTASAFQIAVANDRSSRSWLSDMGTYFMAMTVGYMVARLNQSCNIRSEVNILRR